MDNKSFKLACSLRLGSDICQNHTCICGMEVERDGAHGLSCKNSAGRQARHSQVNELIKRALVAGGTNAIREPPGLSRVDGKRPDGMSLYSWKVGKPLLWDFTCGDTLAPSYVEQSSKEAGKVASNAETTKIRHYAHLENDFVFVPVCIETLGAWGKDGLKLINEIGKLTTQQSGDIKSTSYLFQSIGMAVQRGNVMSILGTIPQDKEAMEEIYYL